MGDDAWSALTEVNEVYKKEKAVCEEAFESLEYFNNEIMAAFEGYSCNECGSGLIMPPKRDIEAIEAEYTCKSCGRVDGIYL